MNTYRDAKRMAKALEAALRARDVPISHGESLDLVARQFGLNDWNVLSAQIKREEAAASRRTRVCTGWDFIREHPTEFDYGLDTDARRSGRRAALIRYMRAQAPTRYRDVAQVFGCLAQHVWAGHYHGRRIEIRAELATQGVSHGATVWARVDQTRGHVLAFDNLKDSRDVWCAGSYGRSENIRDWEGLRGPSPLM